jgi:extracellular elastinolytic metalloproteinase
VSTRRRGRGLLAVTTVAATAVAMTASSGALAAQQGPKADPAPSAHGEQAGNREAKGYYDARTPSTRVAYTKAAQTMAKQGAAAEKYRDSLGTQGIVSLDPNTGTPKQVAKLNGFLTGPSRKAPAQIVLDYIRAHPEIFHLSDADLQTLRLRKDYKDIIGSHHISWEQWVNGVPLFANGIIGHVTKRGELVSIQGSPVPGLGGLAAARSGGTSVSADGARTVAAKDVGGKAKTTTAKTAASVKRWANGDYAKPVWFYTANGLRKGWATYTQAGGTLNYAHVIDAQTGGVLYRRPLSQDANGDGLVQDNYPGAPRGGTQKKVNFFRAGFLQPGAKSLTEGTSVYAFADINDDNAANPGETVEVPGVPNAEYKLVPFTGDPGCSAAFVCTWDPDTPNSWRTNLNQDVTNGFYLASNFHAHLKKSPIGFNAAAGNFEAKGGDPVRLNAIDGANTANGLPDGGHIDNANMNTPPDGQSPTMQMYLFHFPGDDTDPFIPSSSSNDASILYHEYTHGLSNRLVVDASGNSTLNSPQAGGMGEGWSDFYAMDYLVGKGFEKNTRRDGEVIEGKYVIGGGLFRNEAMDCRVGSTHANCVAPDGTQGGYTYGDTANLAGRGMEVHDVGEFWAQALWDVRERLGSEKAMMLTTRAMELSPADPSILDMRNAILQADMVAFRGEHVNDLWRIFAARGMGWFAGSVDAADTRPAEDFHLPPSGPGATLTGTVTDKLTGQPVAGILVFIGGHDSGYTGDYADVTDAQGKYSIDNVLPGTYPKLVVAGKGYEILNQPVTIATGGSTADFQPRRDWAASQGGGEVVGFTGPDLSAFACGPTGSIDLSQGTGWGSTTGDNAGTPTNQPVPKRVDIELPETVDISTFSVDPSNTCGDPGSAATAGFRIETSADGTTWATAAEGTFGAADRARYNEVTPTGNTTGVKFVRFWILSPQVPDIGTNCPDGAFAGCQFMDMMELQVFGTN